LKVNKEERKRAQKARKKRRESREREAFPSDFEPSLYDLLSNQNM